MTRHCLFCIAALALLAASLSSCKEEPVVEEVIRPVRYEVATLGAEATARSFAGVARSGVESRLSFRVSGNVFELPVSVGDTVEEGDLIAQLDTADYEVALQQAEAAVSAARATQRNAEAEFERIGRLFENGTASRSEFDAARAAADSARAMVRANRQQVQAARDQITYCTLLAPNAGAIAEVLVEVNENVESGQPIVVLTGGSDENLEVETPVPGQLIARLSRGMMTTVTFNGVPGQVFEAEITEVGVVAAGGTTFPVTVRLLEVHPGIRAGMTAEVTFPFEPSSETPRILLPIHAVGGDRHGEYVYVIEDLDPPEEGMGRVVRREVTTGEISERGLEIVSGVEDGDRVVTMGVSQIEDGQQVRLLAPEGR